MRYDILIVIFAMAAVTYFTRVGSFMLLHQTGIPDWLEKWLKHVPTAILTALIVPSLLLPEGFIDVSLHNHYLVAGLCAVIMAYKTGNALFTMLFGMSAMFIMHFSGL